MCAYGEKELKNKVHIYHSNSILQHKVELKNKRERKKNTISFGHKCMHKNANPNHTKLGSSYALYGHPPKSRDKGHAMQKT